MLVWVEIRLRLIIYVKINDKVRVFDLLRLKFCINIVLGEIILMFFKRINMFVLIFLMVYYYKILE